ncbi:hypothetical protein FRB95_000093 [Tulasnella sp. JGI-2019a]|nr:hypothetical protein FRB95_000093 [Tulasnella sp. JGI-2019a]
MSSSSSTVTPGRSRHNPSSSSSTVTTKQPLPRSSLSKTFPDPSAPDGEKGGIPVTPAVLRSIFASSRTTLEERNISRVAFFRFTGFLLSCLTISLAAARNRGVRQVASLSMA